MLICLVTLQLILFTYLLAVHRHKEYAYLVLSAIALLWFFVFSHMFMAKRGGLDTSVKRMLFLSERIYRWFQYKSILLYELGYCLALGRFLFPLSFLLSAYAQAKSLKFGLSKRKILILSSILPAVFLIIYTPAVFTRLSAYSSLRTFIMYFSLITTWLYIIAGLVILILEARTIVIRKMRIHFVLRVILLLAMSNLYLVYSPQDPGLIYTSLDWARIRHFNLWYLNSYLSPTLYMVVILLNTLALLAGFISSVSLAGFELLEDRETSVLEVKYSNANTNGGMFIHGIKNQILVNKVLADELNNDLKNEDKDREEIAQLAEKLKQNNDSLLDHLDRLHKSLQTKTMKMKRTDLDDVFAEAESLLYKKYPEAQLQRRQSEKIYIMADLDQLASAWTNILMNAWEATLAAKKQSPITVEVRKTRHDAVILFTDRGEGIDKRNLKRVFDPFFTTKNTKQNWGQGLSHVYMIVKKHMGTVKIDSRTGIGTQVYVALPLLKE